MSNDLRTFINLVLVACEDKEVKSRILSILRLPWNARNAILHNFVEEMKKQNAPSDFISAVGLLKKDKVAAQVLELLG